MPNANENFTREIENYEKQLIDIDTLSEKAHEAQKEKDDLRHKLELLEKRVKVNQLYYLKKFHIKILEIFWQNHKTMEKIKWEKTMMKIYHFILVTEIFSFTDIKNQIGLKKIDFDFAGTIFLLVMVPYLLIAGFYGMYVCNNKCVPTKDC